MESCSIRFPGLGRPMVDIRSEAEAHGNAPGLPGAIRPPKGSKKWKPLITPLVSPIMGSYWGGYFKMLFVEKVKVLCYKAWLLRALQDPRFSPDFGGSSWE